MQASVVAGTSSPKVNLTRLTCRREESGTTVSISGTITTDEKNMDPYRQTAAIFKQIGAVLEAVGSRKEDVVRTRMLVSDIKDWPKVARAHLEFFGDIMPVNTTLAVNNKDPRVKVSVDADAFIAPGKQRVHVSSGAPWEPVIGYSRATRVGKKVWIAGTTATDEKGNLIDDPDPYVQTKAIFKKWNIALHKVGGSLDNVVAARVYLTDMKDWLRVKQAYVDFLGKNSNVSPIEIPKNGLVEPSLKVEIEADAFIPKLS